VIRGYKRQRLQQTIARVIAE